MNRVYVLTTRGWELDGSCPSHVPSEVTRCFQKTGATQVFFDGFDAVPMNPMRPLASQPSPARRIEYSYLPARHTTEVDEVVSVVAGVALVGLGVLAAVVSLSRT